MNVLHSGMAIGDHYSQNLPTKRVAADCLIVDRLGRVLVVEPTYKSTWDLPGGIVEPDESPRAAAAREVAEEVGLVVEPGALLALDWVGRMGEVTEVLATIFDGGATAVGSDALTPAADEIRTAAFVTVPEAQRLLDDEAALRLVAAIDAQEHKRSVYLENGLPVSTSKGSPASFKPAS